MKKKEPEISVKLASPLEILWQQTKEATEQRIKINEDNLIVEKELLKICEQKLKTFDQTNGNKKS